MPSGMMCEMADNDSHLQPGSYSNQELQAMGAERTAVIRQVIALKHQIREKTAQLEILERRLTRSRPAKTT